MVSASIVMSEELFLCSICLDVYTDPVTTPCGHNYCESCITHYWDTSDVCQCPLCNEAFYKRLTVNKVLSEMADQFRSHRLKLEYEAKTETEVQQMIQERRVKIQEAKDSVALSRKDADAEIADSMQVFNLIISCIERSQAEVIGVIEEKHKTTEERAECVIKELQQEITNLEKRSSELKQISHTEDHLHLIQNFTSINTPPPIKDWTKVNVHRSSYVGTARTAVSQLDGVSSVWKKLSDNKERFSTSVSVLGKQRLSSGKLYYEVQVKGKTAWSLGVSRESINRKGTITLIPNNGYWTIWLRNGNEYKANAGHYSVFLPVRETVQKVGVFVDYEEGLVSFYDAEARVHLYSFTGCTFTEKLCPYFSPCANNGGKNSSPLIISPVIQ